mmetsp:Transcript_783/g.3039  ORF Transcript_783/g.3039 Transcript_783/m.3039 type:complete len:460 (+) Transcript_783:642-2021(+)
MLCSTSGRLDMNSRMSTTMTGRPAVPEPALPLALPPLLRAAKGPDAPKLTGTPRALMPLWIERLSRLKGTSPFWSRAPPPAVTPSFLQSICFAKMRPSKALFSSCTLLTNCCASMLSSYMSKKHLSTSRPGPPPAQKVSSSRMTCACMSYTTTARGRKSHSGLMHGPSCVAWKNTRHGGGAPLPPPPPLAPCTSTERYDSPSAIPPGRQLPSDPPVLAVPAAPITWAALARTAAGVAALLLSAPVLAPVPAVPPPPPSPPRALRFLGFPAARTGLDLSLAYARCMNCSAPSVSTDSSCSAVPWSLTTTSTGTSSSKSCSAATSPSTSRSRPHLGSGSRQMTSAPDPPLLVATRRCAESNTERAMSSDSHTERWPSDSRNPTRYARKVAASCVSNRVAIVRSVLRSPRMSLRRRGSRCQTVPFCRLTSSSIGASNPCSTVRPVTSSSVDVASSFRQCSIA